MGECLPLRNRWFADSPLERAGFEPSVPGESGFDFAREVRGRLFAGGSGIRTFGTSRKEPLSLSLFGGFGPEVSRLCLCDSLWTRLRGGDRAEPSVPGES